MRKTALLFIAFLTACTTVWADAGIILVKGAEEVCVYNSLRGVGRKSFRPKEKGIVQKITVPEEQCKDLMHLIADGNSSWIRLLPGETVEVNVGNTPWKFAGDEKKINAYLYDWTQKFWLEKPNSLTMIVQVMFSEIPSEKKKRPAVTDLYQPEYRDWIEHWEKRALADLEKTKLKDEKFVAEQRERIHYNWIELQCHDYRIASMQVEIPKEALEFVRQERFDNPGFMDYPGCEEVLRAYFDIADELQLFSYTSTDFLRKRAERIALPELREKYILNTLQMEFDFGSLYQGEAVLESVKDMIVSEEGKKIWEKCLQQYKAWVSDAQNPEGKDIVPFRFEDIKGNKVDPSGFYGKYLFIDVWATWCGPCKAQIPYLKRLMEGLKGRDIAFLSISADRPKDKETWKQMLKEFGLEDHGVIAPDAFNHKFFETYGIKRVPHFILVDPLGKVVSVKSRRPSDPVLKVQLEELLDTYDRNKTVISGRIDTTGGIVSLVKPGGMGRRFAEVKAKDRDFTLSALVEQSGFYTLVCGPKSFYHVWITPGAKISCNQDAAVIFSGTHAEMNNLMAELNLKYGRTGIPQAGEVFDRSRGQRLKKLYDEIVRKIESSSLSQQEKDALTGYWQGNLLNQMYSKILSSKVFGKGNPRPEVRKGYSDAVLRLQLLPEIVHSFQWFDVLQEWLYAKLEAGMIKIQSEESWLADLAKGIENEELRESYVMEALRLNMLREFLYKMEDNIENVRPFVKKTENQKLLDVMPTQIAEKRKIFANATPGTDLSHFSFKNAQGKEVTLSDFKGKYIFIDLWSTGCNPCVGEIPYLRDMEKKLAGKPIKWVSISLDIKKQAWTDFLEKNKMAGTQLICDKGFKHPFIKQVGMGGIPQFLLLDKEGKVIDANTLRPSNPILGEMLKFIMKRD